jgi:hypothetical protein
MSYATFKMLGYSWNGMDDAPDWSGLQKAGIRIRRGARPSPALFHPGRPVVIYDSKRRTIPAYGRFTSDVFPLEPPEHGCALAIWFLASAAIDHSGAAPRLHDVLPGFDTRQKSYRKLERHQYEALVEAIDGAPAVRRYVC